MRIEMACRLSLYLTLMLATACLGYAELFFLPFIPYVLVPLGLLLVLAFFFEGRWLLPIWAANVLGVVITGGTFLWLRYLYLQRLAGTDTFMGTIPWPAALLPQVGPLLMLLLLIKLFRPKQEHDYWLLQTIGFLEVALACVLAGEALFGILLFAYMLCGLWSLGLFQLARLRGRFPLEPAPSQKSEVRGQRSDEGPSLTSDLRPLTSDLGPLRVPWRWIGLARATRWAVAAAALGLVLFLLAPRQADTIWDASILTSSSVGPIEVGAGADMDLNRTGTVRMSEDVAFEVQVTDKENGGRPKLNLSERQCWRGVVLDNYERGRWRPFNPGIIFQAIGILPQVTVPSRLPRYEGVHLHKNKELPSLGPDQYFLTFHVNPKKAHGVFLAEPVILGPGKGDHPYRALRGPDQTYHFQMFYELDGTLIPLPRRGKEGDGSCSYVQVTVPPRPGQEDLLRPRSLVDRNFHRINFKYRPIPEIRSWTAALLDRLAGEGRYGLTPEHVRLDGKGRVAPQYREVVARALSKYLATSGEFSYTLELRRQDRKLDPNVDFLRNVKQGHCERFSSALALMLRSHGIPTRIVKGYRGIDDAGGGRYLIRQNHAHSWVEALVPARKVRGFLCWLTLDPTPGGEADEESSFSWAGLLANVLGGLEIFWKSFLVELNPETQQAAAVRLWNYLALSSRLEWIGESYSGRFWAKPGFWIQLLLASLCAIWLTRRLRRRAQARSRRVPGVAFYARLLAIFSRRCRLQPQPAQTAREFGETARSLLLQRSAPAALTDLPVRVADLFYQVRFGRQTVEEAVCREMNRQLDQLDRTLAGSQESLSERGQAGALQKPEKQPGVPGD
jgi:hypothetical protein